MDPCISYRLDQGPPLWTFRALHLQGDVQVLVTPSIGAWLNHRHPDKCPSLSCVKVCLFNVCVSCSRDGTGVTLKEMYSRGDGDGAVLFNAFTVRLLFPSTHARSQTRSRPFSFLKVAHRWAAKSPPVSTRTREIPWTKCTDLRPRSFEADFQTYQNFNKYDILQEWFDSQIDPLPISHSSVQELSSQRLGHVFYFFSQVLRGFKRFGIHHTVGATIESACSCPNAVEYLKKSPMQAFSTLSFNCASRHVRHLSSTAKENRTPRRACEKSRATSTCAAQRT